MAEVKKVVSPSKVLAIKEAADIDALCKSVNIGLNPISVAIIHSIIKLYEEKKDKITLWDTNKAVNSVLKHPEYVKAVKQIQAQQARQ